MTTVYIKTPEGQREIETRARRISPRARSTLILVDGKRTTADLAKLVQEHAETLQSLLDAGLIAVVAPVAPAKAAPPSSTEGTPAAAPSAPAKASLESLRREAVRAVNDLLGPEADSLALKMERAATANDLQATLERAVAYIANARGGAAAAKFAARFLPESS